MARSIRSVIRQTATMIIVLATGPLAATSAGAQPPATFPKASLELRGGAVSPSVTFAGDSDPWQPGSTASFGGNFDFRPARNFGFDVGVDVALASFGAGGTINTTGGRRGVTDREYMFTLGPRLIIPDANDQLLLSIGGGYAYVQYDEIAAAQPNEIITGFSGGSRSGSGGYVFMQVDFAPSPNGAFTFGLRVGTVFVDTEGTKVGRFPGGTTTRDNWPTVLGTIGFRFGH